MKLNFWQWLGLILFVVALGLIIWRETSNSTEPTRTIPDIPTVEDDTPTTTTAPATMPS